MHCATINFTKDFILIRKKIYKIIEVDTEQNIASKIYDVLMMIIIILSIIPLAFVNQKNWMITIDKITVIIFIIDYIMRWLTADLKFEGKKGFFIYPFSPLALIDLLSILPSLTLINSSFRLLKIFRLFL